MPKPESEINRKPLSRITESNSLYSDLDKMSSVDRLAAINKEDQSIAHAVEQCLPQIRALSQKITEQLKSGHRWFNIGAGTSGRLGVLDASELPPTYGVAKNLVVGIIAGGDKALRDAVEGAEDDQEQGWEDLRNQGVQKGDVVLGIAASGTTPYVLGALQKCKENGVITASITCNPNSPIEDFSDFPVTCVVGPEIVNGSTRMKAGTATKMILNMLSTDAMIGLGRVKGNKMIKMKPSNIKLFERGTKMIMEETGVNEEKARALLSQHGSADEAIKQCNS